MNKNNFYKFTMSEDGTIPARLDLFGYIGGDGFWVQGFDEVAFKREMESIPENQPLEIGINSNGGSVTVALAIYNMIARHKGTVTIRVLGMAASAATIITSVPNAKVIMPTGSMMLIHNVRTSVEGVTPDELREAAVNVDKLRESVLDVYERKTCKERAVLDDLMSHESYLTAKEAVNYGFADELDESVKVDGKVVQNVFMVNGLAVPVHSVPKSIDNIAVMPSAPAQISAKEAGTMDIEKLKNEYPELVEAIRKEAADSATMAERNRIKAIEDIATAGHDEMVQCAKFNNAITAEMLAVEILKADKARNAKMLADRVNDAKAVNEVVPTLGNEGIDINAEKKTKENAELKAIVDAGKKGFARK